MNAVDGYQYETSRKNLTAGIQSSDKTQRSFDDQRFCVSICGDRSLRAIIAWLLIAMLITATDVAKAGPFQDFFRSLRSAFTHPETKEKPRRHRTSHKHNETPPSDASNSQTSRSPVSSPPGEREVRVAKAASGVNQQTTELPYYGAAVPGKPGLVTSPFAPDSGYVDVTGFPRGTAVEDPYTGKIFLTP
jgi:hypothetical protein